MAEHATGSGCARTGSWFVENGYMTRKGEAGNYEGIQDQIREVIISAGMDPDDRKANDMARWLLDAGIPLTKETLRGKQDISAISFPLKTQVLADAGAAGIADGIGASGGNLADPVSSAKKAVENAQRLVQNMDVSRPLKDVNSDDTLSEKSDNNSHLPQKDDDSDAAGYREFSGKGNHSYLEEVKRQLFIEEERYALSAEANLKLLRRGMAIDLTDMEKTVNQLKASVSGIAQALFGDHREISGEALTKAGKSASYVPASVNAMTPEEKFTLFRITNHTVAGILESPAAVVGAFKDEFKVATLDDIYRKGTEIKAVFLRARETYEAVGTSPREDLGDSMTRAFRNIGDMLREMKLDVNDENCRAVRILGWNHARITEESIEQVKAWDRKLNDVVGRLKPSAVLQLIREGRNPLEMTMDELGQSLDDNDREDQETADRYARFLYKMEKSGKISEEEKESYIGIYRLFENLKKHDNAAIGTLLQTGAEMTISNLLTADRTISRSHRLMDYSISDTFGGVEAGERKNAAIDDQIDTAFIYYAAKADSAYENMTPEKMFLFEEEGNVIEDSFLEDFADAMEDLPDDADSEKAWNRQQTADIRRVLADGDSEKSAAVLEKSIEAVTVSNIEAMQGLFGSRRPGRDAKNIWKDLRSRTGDTDKIDREVSEDEQSLQNLREYTDRTRELAESVMEQISESDSYIDVQALRLIHRELSLASSLSETGNYEVPVRVGDETLSMNIRLEKADGRKPSMKAVMDAGDFGVISADMEIQDGIVTGMLGTSGSATPQIRVFMERLRSLMEKTDGDQNLSILYDVRNSQNSLSADADPVTDPRAGIQGASDGELLDLATGFVRTVCACMQ
jgi:hypothetical protein